MEGCIYMIDTIIFDIGMVLVNYDWKGYLEGFGYEPQVTKTIGESVFLHEHWGECDRGVLSDEELVEMFVKKAPEYKKEIQEVFASLGDTVHPFDYADSWIEGLKKAGYRVYALSNYPKKTYEHGKDKLSFLEKMDGAVLSYRVKSIKPESKIYEYLLNGYNIIPENAVFIDDLEANLSKAREFGIHTIQMKSYGQAVEDLKKLGVTFN